jgi:hypothetical protein
MPSATPCLNLQRGHPSVKDRQKENALRIYYGINIDPAEKYIITSQEN